MADHDLPGRAVPAGRPRHPDGDRARPARRGAAASTPSGRPTAGSCATPSCRWRRSPRRPTGSASGPASSTSGRATPPAWQSTFSTLDDLAPGRILCGLGAWWDPLAAKVGIDAIDTAAGDARGGHRRPWSARRRDGHARRHPRAPRRRRARLRVPGAPPEGRPDLHRGDRHADDGARRRDRRRRRAQLPRRPVLQRRGDGGARARCGEGRAHPRRRRPPAARRVQHRPRPQGRARRRPADGHAVPRPAAAHHEGVRRAPGAARRDRRAC